MVERGPVVALGRLIHPHHASVGRARAEKADSEAVLIEPAGGARGVV